MGAVWVLHDHGLVRPPILHLMTTLAAPAALPLPATPIMGREWDLAPALAILERPDVRLLTPPGTGGAGKTRLGLGPAGQLGGRFTGGAVFVDLSPVVDPGLVAATIAAA